MNSAKEEWKIEEHPDIIIKVLESQIKQLYKQSKVGLVSVLVVGISICFALWQVLPPWELALWMAGLLLISFVRLLLLLAFQRKNPEGSGIKKWGRWHATGTSFSGLMWAIPSFFLWPENPPEYHFVWILCILPLSASAVSTYYTWKPSYIPFILLCVVPISLRLFYEGGLIEIVLGCLGLFFIVVLIQAGSLMHAASVRTLIVGFRNESLSAFLSAERTKQKELTRQLQKAHDQLHKISLTDELTGLFNRRYLNATIQKQVAQVLRNYRNSHQGSDKRNSNNTDILFSMVDLDHFKAVNDAYGHSAGDQVLKQTSQLLTKSCRATDTIIRWGGEEFLVVSQNVCRESYTLLAEHIRQAVATHKFDIARESPLHLTCSIGTTIFPFLTNSPEAMNWEKIVELADACLYAAKRSGRNAWVAVMPTDLTTSEDLTPDLAKRLPDLIKEGKLDMQTSLNENTDVCWTD